MAIEVRLRRDRLVVSNPGGLYGITVDRLGRDAVTSARNARLVAISQHVRTPDGGRVIEALATGLPVVTRALADAGLPRPHFIDAGIRFTVILHRASRAVSVSGSTSGRRTRSASGSASGSRERSAAGSRSLNASEQAVYDALGTASRSAADLHQALGLSTPNIRKALRKLREIDLVEQIGGRGRPTTYRRLAS
jgi:ATP-dependent DNA helicase RecG